MVRINLIQPSKLSDQHLIAEYNEILMLIGHVKKNPELKNIPKKYCLGEGHIKFFKNKLIYLKNRHEKIKLEMLKRGFKAEKTINLKKFSDSYLNDFNPKPSDKKLIKKRLKEKIMKKPEFYRYYRIKKGRNFFIKLLE
jgi:deoxyribonuclease (pyrimidine dimer)